MTHTVHPYAHRLGIIRTWKSRWFAANPAEYRDGIRVDAALRAYLSKRLRGAYVSSIEIERTEKELRIIIATSRPGVIIGRSGENATKLRNDIKKLITQIN